MNQDSTKSQGNGKPYKAYLRARALGLRVQGSRRSKTMQVSSWDNLEDSAPVFCFHATRSISSQKHWYHAGTAVPFYACIACKPGLQAKYLSNVFCFSFFGG